MVPIEVRLYDDNISHTLEQCGFYTFTGSKEPSGITYVVGQESNSGISIFTDNYLNRRTIKRDTADYKIAFLVESRVLYPKPYKKIHRVAKLVDLIVTHDMEVVNRYENSVFTPYGGSWVTEEDLERQWEKTKLISCIASDNTRTEGHRLRHSLVARFSQEYEWDLWGREYKKFESKVDPLANYMYSIAIQNGRYETYFTEILTDPFLLRTIPIFWGAPDIGKIFNTNGFYIFNTESELQHILEKISKDDYYSKLKYIEENYQIALTMRNSDELLLKAIKANRKS
jgi:hypothetical protein